MKNTKNNYSSKPKDYSYNNNNTNKSIDNTKKSINNINKSIDNYLVAKKKSFSYLNSEILVNSDK